MARRGADTALVVTPSYFKGRMTPAALEAHFQAVADASPIPVILYNVPSNTGVDMAAAPVIKLARHPNIIGIKDSSGDLQKMALIIRETAPAFQVLAGSTGYILPALAIGAVGCIGALANLAARPLDRLITCARSGELAEARAIQARLFPERAPAISGFRIAGLSQPCLSVGGDWYDYLLLASGRVAVVLGDVAGKGTGAALLMASTRSILRMRAEQIDSPAALLTEVNRVLTADLPSAKFVTLIYAVLDPDRRTVTFGNAGHLPPVLVDRSVARTLDARLGLPLGIMEGGYGEHEVGMRAGDRLVLYTDGVVEATSPASEEYGEARLLRHLAGRSASAESLLAEVLAHGEGRPAADDITIVTIEATG
jgi:hypothetical protein